MPHGPFDGETRQVVLDRPDPPLPWSNAVGSEGTLGRVTQTGGGTTASNKARPRRLTPDRDNHIRPIRGRCRISPREVNEIAGRDDPAIASTTASREAGCGA